MPKQPVTYYGGKQGMLKHILPLIPSHNIYTECFFGGGSVFFAKEPSPSEIINDNNHQVINFFEQVKTNFTALKQKIEASLFSRATYKIARVTWEMPHLFTPLQRAWGFFVGFNMGFASSIDGGWGYDKFGKRAKTFLNKKLRFDTSVAERLKSVTVECQDAIKVFDLYDSKDTFHYIDPPYINTHQGSYAGYTETDYKDLLETLTHAKGKFLLSCYPSDLLDQYAQNNDWYVLHFDKVLAASKSVSGTSKPRKTEVLVANYPISSSGL